MVVFIWYWYLRIVCWGGNCCFGGLFPCFGGFNVIVCGGRFDGVCINLYVECGF